MSRKEAKRLNKATAKSAVQTNGGEGQSIDPSPYVHQQPKLKRKLNIRNKIALTERQSLIETPDV